MVTGVIHFDMELYKSIYGDVWLDMRKIGKNKKKLSKNLRGF